MTRLLRGRCLALLMSALVGGCISTNTPGDLALTSVTAVDWHDQAELPGRGASPIIGMVSDQAVVRAGQSLTGGEKPHRPMLKVEFTSATDLSRLVIENSWTLGVYAYFCGRDERSSPGMSYPFVFWQGSRLGQYERDPIQAPTGERISYYFFVNVAGEERPRDTPPQQAFDLRQKPEDVCFVLRGGNNWGTGYRSTALTVPSSVIAAAFHY